MLSVIEEVANCKDTLEARDLAKSYGMDAMGTSIFGFEINTLKGHNKEFKELMGRFQEVNWKRIAENAVDPKILKFFRFRISNADLEKCFRNLLRDVSEHREKNNIQRKDVFHYVEQLTDKGIGSDQLSRNKKLSEEQMFIQLYALFMGGFDTSSIVISFTLLELCLNQDVQEKLRDEICACLKKHGEFTYEALMEMEYLDRVVSGKYELVQFFCNFLY